MIIIAIISEDLGSIYARMHVMTMVPLVSCVGRNGNGPSRRETKAGRADGSNDDDDDDAVVEDGDDAVVTLAACVPVIAPPLSST